MKRNYCAMVAVLALLAAAGCHYGALEADYGKSYRMARDGQILNPQASKNLQPVTGISGEAAAASGERYSQSFGKSPQKPASKSCAVSVISGGTAGTGQDAYGK